MNIQNSFLKKLSSRKIRLSLVVLVMVSVLLYARVSDGPSEVAALLTRDDVADLVISELIAPKTLNHDVVAFLDAVPLVATDTVTVFYDEGGTYVMDDTTWFVWIDDNPLAEFAHETRFVFLDAQTGSYEVFTELWWPKLNGVVLWSKQTDWEDPVDVIYSTIHLEP